MFFGLILAAVDIWWSCFDTWGPSLSFAISCLLYFVRFVWFNTFFCVRHFPILYRHGNRHLKKEIIYRSKFDDNLTYLNCHPLMSYTGAISSFCRLYSGVRAQLAAIFNLMLALHHSWHIIMVDSIISPPMQEFLFGWGKPSEWSDDLSCIHCITAIEENILWGPLSFQLQSVWFQFNITNCQLGG